MFDVITYDFSSDRLRDKVADILEGFGHRVQYSVFEVDLEAKSFEQLTRRLQALLADADSAHIRCYRLCESCDRASFVIGDARPEKGAAIWA